MLIAITKINRITKSLAYLPLLWSSVHMKSTGVSAAQSAGSHHLSHLNQYLRNVVSTTVLRLRWDDSEQLLHASLAVSRYRSECEIDDRDYLLQWWEAHDGAYPTVAAQYACHNCSMWTTVFSVWEYCQQVTVLAFTKEC